MNPDWFAISKDAYALFRRLADEARAATPDAAAMLMAAAHEAESIGVRAWARAVKS